MRQSDVQGPRSERHQAPGPPTDGRREDQASIDDGARHPGDCPRDRREQYIRYKNRPVDHG